MRALRRCFKHIPIECSVLEQKGGYSRLKGYGITDRVSIVGDYLFQIILETVLGLV